MRRRLIRIVGLLVLTAATGILPAQVPGLGQPGLPPALAKLFGSTTAFSAKVEARLVNKGPTDSMTVPMIFAMLEGKMRTEIDMARVQSTDMAADTAANLKLMGVDRLVHVLRPDTKKTLIIYPNLKAYVEIPMTATEIADWDRKYEVTTRRLAEETLDGHPCVKNKVVVSAREDQSHEALAWNATDLKGFPIKIQIHRPEGAMVMSYREIKFEKPGAHLFEAPAAYTKHESHEKLLQAALMKWIGGPK